MLANILIQYSLFGICTLISMYQLSETQIANITVESHVYQCSITLLLATSYVLLAVGFYHVYSLMMTRRAAVNPDLDGMFSIDSDESMHDDKKSTPPAAAGAVAVPVQQVMRPSMPAFHNPQAYRRLMDELRVLDPDVDFTNGIPCEAGAALRQPSAAHSELPPPVATNTYTIARHINMVPQSQICEITPADPRFQQYSSANDVVVANPMYAGPVNNTSSPAQIQATVVNDDDTVSVLSEAPPSSAAMARTMHMVPAAVLMAIENAKHNAMLQDSAKAPLQGMKSSKTDHPGHCKQKKGMLTPEGLVEDVDFCLSVYGYGIVIFVVYYAIDMTILTPALSMLCGLMTISMRDVLTMWRVHDNSAREDARLLAKTISVVCFILQILTITELFIATGHIPNSDLLTSSPSYIALTFVFPSVACGLLVLLPRECSQARHIKRAFPTTALIAIFMVIWARSVDMMLTHHERTTADAFESYASQMTQYITSANSMHTNPGATASQGSGGGGDMVVSDMASQFAAHTTPVAQLSTASFENLADEESAVLQRLTQPIAHEIPVLSILLEPLFKLALTFSVITGTVNHKTVEISACICFIVAIKQMLLPLDDAVSTSINYEHIIRAATMAACSMAFSVLRYVSCLSEWIRS